MFPSEAQLHVSTYTYKEARNHFLKLISIPVSWTPTVVAPGELVPSRENNSNREHLRSNTDWIVEWTRASRVSKAFQSERLEIGSPFAGYYVATKLANRGTVEPLDLRVEELQSSKTWRWKNNELENLWTWKSKNYGTSKPGNLRIEEFLLCRSKKGPIFMNFFFSNECTNFNVLFVKCLLFLSPLPIHKAT